MKANTSSISIVPDRLLSDRPDLAALCAFVAGFRCFHSLLRLRNGLIAAWGWGARYCLIFRPVWLLFPQSLVAAEHWGGLTLQEGAG